MTSASEKKITTFQLFFQSREQVVVRRRQIRRIGWVIKTFEVQVGHLISGLQVPGEPGRCRERTRPHRWISRGVFPTKCPSLAPAEMSNNPRWQFGPLEDNQWGGCRLDPQKFGARNFPAAFCTRNFSGRVEPLCRHYIDCCFVSGP